MLKKLSPEETQLFRALLFQILNFLNVFKDNQ